MKTTFIYTLSDPRNNQIRYVGKSDKPTKRFRQHLREKKNNKKCNWIQSLLSKGNNPIIEILDEVLISEWEYWEIYWIKQMKLWGFNLLNVTNGGNSPPKMWGNKYLKGKTPWNKGLTKESNEILRQSGEKISKIKKGKKLGPFSEKHKMNLSNSLKGKNKGRIPPNIGIGKKICQFDLNGNFIKTWESINGCGRSLKLEAGGISLSCNGKRKSAGGFIWVFYSHNKEKLQNKVKEIIIKLKQKPKRNYSKEALNRISTANSIKTYQINSNDYKIIKIWDSGTKAGKELNLTPSNIHNCCNSRSLTCGGYKWAFADKNNILNIGDIYFNYVPFLYSTLEEIYFNKLEKFRKIKNNKVNPFRSINHKNGRVLLFKTQRECKNVLGVSISTIQRSLKKLTIQRIQKYSFEWI